MGELHHRAVCQRALEIGRVDAADPLFAVVLNDRLESRTRATVNSFAAQSDALGQIAGGLAIGAVAGLVSIPAALVLAATLLLAAPLTLGRPDPGTDPGTDSGTVPGSVPETSDLGTMS